MDYRTFVHKKKNINGITVTFLVTVMLALSHSCTKAKNEVIKSFENKADIPTMKSLNVTTLISDSGITRYKIITKEWLMFEKAKEPYWYFPQGIHLDKFDSAYQVEAFIEGDTAYFYKNKQLWKLDGNVKMKNEKGEKFNTEQLFWDQRERKIYSNVAIHIERSGKIINGIGFESNESMTKYDFYESSGEFLFTPNQANDSTKVDSISKPVVDEPIVTTPKRNVTPTLKPKTDSISLPDSGKVAIPSKPGGRFKKRIVTPTNEQ